MTLFPRDAASDRQAELGAGLTSLSSLLWQERESLEAILFKLVTEQLIAGTGNVRFLQLADDELRDAAATLRENEVLRAAETQMLARLLDLPPDASLLQIAEVVDEPWPGLLREHRDALRALFAEIETAARANRAVLLAGAEAARAALEHLAPTVGTYDARGGRVVVTPGISLLDRQA
ncbi:MAG TPA: hypothetical protein VHC23_07515 [Jatrophihabitans sp.]|jgi:hypothetical protein|nr:hypothetical protein [Jatrophihabitans sp.]